VSNEKIARLLLYRNDELLRKLAVVSGAHTPISIGRQGYGAIIDLPETYVSRKHAEIIVSDENYLILRDLSSTSGTFVNGRIIKEKRLGHGDSITFGMPNDSYRLTVEYIVPEQIQATPESSWIRVKTPDVPQGMAIKGSRETSDVAELLMQKSEITIGRSKDADIILPQLTITRQHAAIRKTEQGGYMIRDLGSKNGTFVNGKRITEETPLSEHDDILIGAYKFRLRQPAEDIRRQMAIVADGLTRTVNGGKIAILRNLSFKIPAREFVAVMGPSGCGKSTLLKALNGDFPATAGRVSIHGLELHEHYDYLKRLIGYVPQDDIVHRELSVEDSLYYAAKLRLSSDVSNEDIRQKIDEVLENLNIGDPEIRRRPVGDLSGGQRKRVSIAVELLTDPSILFLDEPTSPLDPETIEDFLMCLQQLAEKGTTVLMVTHKPDDLYYVDNIMFLSKGGHLTYYGEKAGYLDFFDAKNVIEVYSKNGTLENGAMWADKYRQKFPVSGLVSNTATAPDRRRDDSLFKQLFWLIARYFHIKTNDRANTAILLAQAPIIAGLLALIFGELELSVLFFMTISAIWFGTNNAAKEIVGELPIYRRERMFNLRILPYILSKIIVLTFFSAIQVAVFVGIIYCFIGSDALSMNSYWKHSGIMLLLAFSATLLGLFISAMVSNTEKVMTIIPIVLIPQIILAGVITTIPEKSVVEFASYAMLSRWGTQGFVYVQDSLRSYMATNPLCPDELTYNTVKGIDFINLPNTLDLPEKLSSNLWAIGILDLVVFIGIYWALKRKDTL
jgi:ABC-type multidrug transport system ATPase subunit/pSer/pThr/pTyr-binding forkhead associated (FHA) protein